VYKNRTADLLWVNVKYLNSFTFGRVEPKMSHIKM